jgi:endonuclease YncB( thermonuclease family)
VKYPDRAACACFHERMTTWTVPATVLRVVDGDTVRLRLDLGWSVYTEKNCRILGVNAPEVATEAGQAARDWAHVTLPEGLAVMFISHSLDKYGRPLGQLRYGPIPYTDYGDTLLAAGHAVVLKY